MKASALSVNSLVMSRLDRLINSAPQLGISPSRAANGSLFMDAGLQALGSIEAGRQIAEICLGGLGLVRLRSSTNYENWSWQVDVHSASPVLACLGSQYAGWSLSHGAGEKAFQALGSGPARAIGSKEPLFDEIGYRDKAERTCMVMEVAAPPPVEVADEVAAKCKVRPENLTLILLPAHSLAGSVQVVARVLETALHKAHALRFPLDKIVDGLGSAPLSPPAPNFLTAMSRTNDAILFAGQVHLFVDAEDEQAEKLAYDLPSSASKDYGPPFAETLKRADYDFYEIDPMLFSPARVTVSSIKTGHSFQAGRIDLERLDESFTGIFS